MSTRRAPRPAAGWHKKQGHEAAALHAARHTGAPRAPSPPMPAPPRRRARRTGHRVPGLVPAALLLFPPLPAPVLGSWVKSCGTRLGIRKDETGAVRLPRILVLITAPVSPLPVLPAAQLFYFKKPPKARPAQVLCLAAAIAVAIALQQRSTPANAPSLRSAPRGCRPSLAAAPRRRTTMELSHPFASRSVRRPLLTLQVNPGPLYCCGQSH